MERIKTTEGDVIVRDARFTIVASRFNDFIVDSLIKASLHCLRQHGANDADIEIVRVPGAFEMPIAVDKVAALWRACGSTVEVMDAIHHDKVLAMTSHLPHLIAYTIVGTASNLEEHTRAEVVKFSAGGFRDFTRIAASDPVMWRDVFLNNREAVLEILQRFSEDLTVLQRAIRWGEGDLLEKLFTRTRQIRRGIVEAHQAGTFDPREPDRVEAEEPGPGTAARPEE